MSRGKYSPSITRALAARDWSEFRYNADKEIPEDYNRETSGEYNERKHFADYDSEGFDSYGYSAFDSDGNYVGGGDGIDRLGYTELDYLRMSADEFNDIM